jgi:excisionase family DNA binding protein
VNDLVLQLPAELVDAIAERAAEIVLERTAAAASPYFTIPEAADYMRCGRRRVDNLLSAGRLTRVKDGRRTLVLRAEVDAMLRGDPTGVALRSPRHLRSVSASHRAR